MQWRIASDEKHAGEWRSNPPALVPKREQACRYSTVEYVSQFKCLIIIAVSMGRRNSGWKSACIRFKGSGRTRVLIRSKEYSVKFHSIEYCWMHQLCGGVTVALIN